MTILLVLPFYRGRELLAALALFSVLFVSVLLIVLALFALREGTLRLIAWLNRRALVRTRTERIVLDEALLASPIPLIRWTKARSLYSFWLGTGSRSEADRARGMEQRQGHASALNEEKAS